MKLKFIFVIFFLLIPTISYSQIVDNITRLSKTITAANIPIHGVSNLVCGTPNTARIDFKPEATAQNIIDANLILTTFDCSNSAQNSFENTQARLSAKNIVDNNKTDKLKLIRAVVGIMLDEFNLHALKINAILDAVDNATTLANLKTAVALIADHPQRTQQQLINAIKNKIDGGTVD